MVLVRGMAGKRPVRPVWPVSGLYQSMQSAGMLISYTKLSSARYDACRTKRSDCAARYMQFV